MTELATTLALDRRGHDLPAAALTRTAVAVVADRAAFEALAGEWRAIEGEAASPVLFQSFAWCHAVWDHAEASGRPFLPRVLAAREGGRLVGILPLKLERRQGRRFATGLGEPFQLYTDAILAADAPPDTVPQLLDAALWLPRADGIVLQKVRADGALARELQARGWRRGTVDLAPFVNLKPHATFRDYHATVTAKTRKNIRNARNRLERDAPLTHAVTSEPQGVRAVIERAYAGRARWLDQEGLTSQAFGAQDFKPFLLSLASHGGTGLDLRAMTLCHGERPIADLWGFVHCGRFYAYMAAWAPEMEQSSPGKLQLEDVIRASFEAGVEVVDFMMPASRYKFTWTEEAVEVSDYLRATTLPGLLVLDLWFGRLRPWLRGIALRLPPSVRRPLIGHRARQASATEPGARSFDA